MGNEGDKGWRRGLSVRRYEDLDSVYGEKQRLRGAIVIAREFLANLKVSGYSKEDQLVVLNEMKRIAKDGLVND